MEVPHNYQVTYRKKINTYIRVRDSLPPEDNYFDRHSSPVMLNAGPMTVGPIADEVFARTDQSSMFDRVRPLCDSFISGQDVVICCFGGSYSGKTYTMFGPGVGFMQSEATYGILPRAVTYLFSALEDRGPRNKELGISLNIRACEFFNKTHRDLLNTNESPTVLTYSSTSKGNRYLNNVTVLECKSASLMMEAVEELMANRLQTATDPESRFFMPTNQGSALVCIQLTQPGLNGTTVVSQALFIELACEVDDLPVVDNFTGQVVLCNFNIDLLYLYESLKRPEAWGSNYNQNIRYYPLFAFLEDALKGSAETAAICCLSPSSHQQNISLQYLYAISIVQQHSQTTLLVTANMRPNDSVESSLPPIEQPYQDFSSLTVSEDNSDKDQTPLKQDGLLERIEEVTESEDEIYSSNEKISHSTEDSQTFSSSDSHNSLSESDAEEVEKKPCESDENFRHKKNNMCSKFNTFVDTTVNSFKTRPVLNPPKEQRSSCSAARRGGVPCVKPQPVPKSGDPTFYNLYELPQNAKPISSAPECEKSAKEVRRERLQLSSSKQQAEVSGSSILSDRRNSNKKTEPSRPFDESGSSLIEDGKNRERKSETSHSLDEAKHLLKLETEISDDCMRLDVVRQRLKDMKKYFEQADPLSKHKMEPWTMDTFEKLNEGIIAQVTNTTHMLAVTDRSMPLTEQGDACLKAQIRNLRQLSWEFTEKRAVIAKAAKRMFDTEGLSRDIVVCDAITTLLDADIEFLNNLLLNNNKCLGKPKSKLEVKALNALRRLNIDELNYCLQVAFSSIIDTQTASRETDAELLDVLSQLNAKDDEILNLRKEMVNLFEENYILKQQMQKEQNQVVRYTNEDRACNSRPAPSHPTSITIRTGSEGRRGPLSIPRQLLSKPTESSHDVKIKDGKVSITKK